MDIQAILAASDSSDEAAEDDHHHVVTHRPYSKQLLQTTTLTTSAVDIERLLTENDDDDDYFEPSTSRYSSQSSASKEPNHPSLSTRNNYNNFQRQSSSFARTAKNGSSVSHSADDWAVLQAILKEDGPEHDDDDTETDYDHSHARLDPWLDDDDDDDLLVHSSSRQSGRQSHYHGPMSVDAILLSSDDESDHEQVDDNLRRATASHHTPIISTLVDETSADLARQLRAIPISDNLTAPSTIGDTTAGPTQYEAIGSNVGIAPTRKARLDAYGCRLDSFTFDDEKKQAPWVDSARFAMHRPLATPLLSSTTVDALEEASQRALAQAKAYELKLLKSGHREIVSPLSVKRRLRPN
jgi:hypothetical protein